MKEFHMHFPLFTYYWSFHLPVPLIVVWSAICCVTDLMAFLHLDLSLARLIFRCFLRRSTLTTLFHYIIISLLHYIYIYIIHYIIHYIMSLFPSYLFQIIHYWNLKCALALHIFRSVCKYVTYW